MIVQSLVALQCSAHVTSSVIEPARRQQRPRTDLRHMRSFCAFPPLSSLAPPRRLSLPPTCPLAARPSHTGGRAAHERVLKQRAWHSNGLCCSKGGARSSDRRQQPWRVPRARAKRRVSALATWGLTMGFSEASGAPGVPTTPTGGSGVGLLFYAGGPGPMGRRERAERGQREGGERERVAKRERERECGGEREREREWQRERERESGVQREFPSPLPGRRGRGRHGAAPHRRHQGRQERQQGLAQGRARGAWALWVHCGCRHRSPRRRTNMFVVLMACSRSAPPAYPTPACILALSEHLGCGSGGWLWHVRG